MTFLFLILPSFAGSTTAYQMQRAILFEQDPAKVEQLLKSGFDVAQPIGCGSFDSLDGAVTVARVDLVKLLLKYGAKPKPGTFVRAAFIASHVAANETVKAFLDAGCNVNAKEPYMMGDERFTTALHNAVWRENSELVTLLLSCANVELNHLNIDSRTPLMIAVEKGNKPLVSLLLAAGADPSIHTAGNHTALSISNQVIEKQKEIQQLLEKPFAK